MFEIEGEVVKNASVNKNVDFTLKYIREYIVGRLYKLIIQNMVQTDSDKEFHKKC